MNYVAKIGASNDVHYYQYNGHGDVVQVANGSTGAIENRYAKLLVLKEIENESN